LITSRKHEQRATKEAVRHGRVSVISRTNLHLLVIATGFHHESRSSPTSLNGLQLASLDGTDMLGLLCCRRESFFGAQWRCVEILSISVHICKRNLS
jgi:hypothetical protein